MTNSFTKKDNKIEPVTGGSQLIHDTEKVLQLIEDKAIAFPTKAEHITIKHDRYKFKQDPNDPLKLWATESVPMNGDVNNILEGIKERLSKWVETIDNDSEWKNMSELEQVKEWMANDPRMKEAVESGIEFSITESDTPGVINVSVSGSSDNPYMRMLAGLPPLEKRYILELEIDGGGINVE